MVSCVDLTGLCVSNKVFRLTVSSLPFHSFFSVVINVFVSLLWVLRLEMTYYVFLCLSLLLFIGKVTCYLTNVSVEGEYSVHWNPFSEWE